MNTEKIGAKRHVVGAGYGLRDWIGQRVTAVIMAVYTLVLLVGVLLLPDFSYESWVSLFSFKVGVLPLGQLLATLAVLSLTYHAWIGIRDLWMDYVKPVAVRLTLHVLTVVWLLVTVVYAAKILWSI